MNGSSPIDMSYLGKEIDINQYNDMVDSLIEFASSEIDRYCNVTTFQQHEVKNEYHTMRVFDRVPYSYGYASPLLYSIFDTMEDYSELSREIMPREYPLQSVTELKVAYNLPNTAQSWTTLTERTPSQNGDFNVVKEFNSTKIIMDRRYPTYGVNNICLSYIAGYPSGHAIFTQLRMACVMMVINALNYKKKMQEVYTIRGSSVQDYSPMFDFETGGMFLSRDVCVILDRWRRPYATPNAYI